MSKILGKLYLNSILWILVPLMIATPLYTYHVAVSKGEQHPFPHATITSTATYYPQDIVFRYIMLGCSSFLALIFYVAFRWIQWQALRTRFQTLPKYLFYLAQGSIGCYCVTIGTIDQEGTGNLHGVCAVIFFIIWLVTIIVMTMYMAKMRQWDTTVMSRTSLRIKQVLALYIAAVWIWCIYNLLKQSSETPNDQDIYVVIVQWNSVLINLFWVLSFVFQWKHFNLAFAAKK